MEHETIVLILAFLIGWVGHAVYSFVLNLGRTSYMVKFVGYALMCCSKLVSEQTNEFLEMKYKSLNIMGVEKNKVKLMRIEDRHSIDIMQQDMVNIMIANYPKPFKHHIEFQNWNQMMKHIENNQRSDYV
jgi:hypothetical protein